jgi:hypothetical protein
VVTGEATDRAGRVSSTSTSVSLDATPPNPPTIGGVTSGGVYQVNQAPPATCTSSDALSGLASCTTSTGPPTTTSGVGTRTVTATATDVAGNTSTSTLTYRVTYAFSGFLLPGLPCEKRFFLLCLLFPFRGPGPPRSPGSNVFEAGSTVPVKFQLRDGGGNIVRAASPPVWLTPVRTNARIGQEVNGPTPPALADSGATFRWDQDEKVYVFTWKTPRAPTGYYWRIGVRLDDGQVYETYVGLR